MLHLSSPLVCTTAAAHDDDELIRTRRGVSRDVDADANIDDGDVGDDDDVDDDDWG